MTLERARPHTNAQEPTIRRNVWCSTVERVLHGRTRPGPASGCAAWRRLLQGRHPAGMIYEFEALDHAHAQAALREFLASPGSFAIETGEGARIDLLASRRTALLTLDCWFFDTVDGLDTVLIQRGDAIRLLECLYQTGDDTQVARVIFGLATRAGRMAG